MVRLRHLHPLAAHTRANVGVIGTTNKYMILVDFRNLTFERELGTHRDSNVKFNPLEHFQAKWIPVRVKKMR